MHVLVFVNAEHHTVRYGFRVLYGAVRRSSAVRCVFRHCGTSFEHGASGAVDPISRVYYIIDLGVSIYFRLRYYRLLLLSFTFVVAQSHSGSSSNNVSWI